MDVLAPMPTHDCASHSMEQKDVEGTKKTESCCHSESKNCSEEQNSSHQEDDDYASGCDCNCNCGCCAVLFIVPQNIQHFVLFAYFDIDDFIHTEKKYSSSLNAIWNPPKV